MGEAMGMERLRKAGAGVFAVVLMALGLASAQVLVPGGQSIGVALKTGGLVVIGAADVGSQASPARKAGLRSGDVITMVNGKEVSEPGELADALKNGKNVVEYMRNGQRRTAVAEPVNDGGVMKLGAWVRSSAAGVGTLSYYDPESGEFGALGHPVTDADTGIVLPVEEGSIYENTIVGVEKGAKGEPGELLGQFYDGEVIGRITGNNELGLFGVADGVPGGLYEDGLETAGRDEVRTGRASLITTVEGRDTGEYECEIMRIESKEPDTNRSFMIRITDERLIGITGGIVQGMSGSPIIQDGKLVGAMTHVLVNDPTRGYGIFIENMLN